MTRASSTTSHRLPRRSALARAFYLEQGVDMSRVQLEGGSRTTRENARQVAKLLGARCQEPWLLVTSAWHMPRAMEEFAATGCQITPYPVDFLTAQTTPWTEYSLAHGLLHLAGHDHGPEMDALTDLAVDAVCP